jgi:WD40 repeat protein
MSMAQLLLVAVLVPIVYLFVKSEGGGDRWNVIDAVVFSPTGNDLAIVAHAGRRVHIDGHLRDVDVSQTVELIGISPASERRLLMKDRRWHVKPGLWEGGSPLAFAPDASYIVIGSLNGSVEIWDIRKGTRQEVLPPGSDPVHSVALASDGSVLAVASFDRLTLSGIYSGAITQLPTRSGIVTSLAFSPDGELLAVCGVFGSELWDVPTARLNRMLTGSCEESRTYSASFSPDNTTLALGCTGEVRLLSITDATEKAIPCRDQIQSVRFSPDGGTLAVADCQTIRLFDAVTLNAKGTLGNRYRVHSLAFSPDSEQLATGDWNGTVTLWDLRTRTPLQELTVGRGTRVHWAVPSLLLAIWCFAWYSMRVRK